MSEIKNVETVVDDKFRLYIPADVTRSEKLDSAKELKAFFRVNPSNKCLEICFSKKRGFSKALEVKGKDGKFRVLIPVSLRQTMTFFYGRSMCLVYSEESGIIKLWPRPQN